MTASEIDPGSAERSGFFRFERRDSDLPFYRGVPPGPTTLGWLAVLVSIAAGFAALMLTQPALHEGFAGFIPPLLFVAIPLITLAAVAGPRAPMALFRRLRLTDLWLILGIYVLNWIVTIAFGLLVANVFHGNANPVGDLAASAAGLDQALLFGWTAVSLFGEELLTILPFLAFFTFLSARMGRRGAMALAVLAASVIFACIHLPTYRWNVPQALIGLVPIRIVLLLPYLITRNILTSAAVHILNDWTIFTMAIIGAFLGVAS